MSGFTRNSMNFNSLTGYDPIVGSPEAPMTDVRVHALQAITPPDPIRRVAMRSYVCTVANASFHRKDGTRIGFRQGYMETDIEATQQYLDAEIRSGNPYIRVASTEEVEEAKMRMDPRGTIKAQVAAEMERELRAKLEAEIYAKLGLSKDVIKDLAGKTDLPLDAAVEEHIIGGTNAESYAAKKDAEKIAGTTVSDRLKKAGVIKVPGATLRMSSEPAPLQGIVSSSNISDAAAGSGS